MTEPTEAQARASLFAKMARVMSSVARVPKSGENTYHHYKYATASDLVDEIRPLLAEQRIAMFISCPSVERIPLTERLDRQTGEYKSVNEVLTRVCLTVTFADGDTGATFAVSWHGEGQDTGDKGLYKAYTGALKYLLTDTFLISTGDDPEADEKADARNAEARPSIPEPPTDKQIGYLANLLGQTGFPSDAAKEAEAIRLWGHGVAEITKAEATQWIDALKNNKALPAIAPSQKAPSATHAPPAAQTPIPTIRLANDNTATAAQIKAIQNICASEHGVSPDRAAKFILDRYDKDLAALTKIEASALIDKLQAATKNLAQ